MKLELNINDQVLVKLTEFGKEVLTKYYRKPIAPELDGYYKFSIWGLAKIFGKEFYNGQINPVIEDNKLIIQ